MVVNMGQELKVTKTDIYKKNFDYSSDKIVVNTFSEKNLMELAVQDKNFKKQHTKLIENDYMLYMHKEGCSYFIKRNKVGTIWQRKDLTQYKDIFYTLEKPAKEMENECAPTRLIILFSSLPDEANYYSPNIATRCFVGQSSSVAKHVLKNTIVMKIMDLNLSHGSYYLNTANNPTFEQDIQQAIDLVSKEHQINAEDIVLYGTCKGGTAALYHGYLGNYKVLSVSPTIKFEDDELSMLNTHLFEKLKTDSIINSLMKVTKKSDKEKFIIESPINFTDYEEYKGLSNEMTKLVSVFDSKISEKSEINKNSMVEQTVYINQLLLSSKNLKKINEKLIQLSKEISKNEKV